MARITTNTERKIIQRNELDTFTDDPAKFVNATDFDISLELESSDMRRLYALGELSSDEVKAFDLFTGIDGIEFTTEIRDSLEGKTTAKYKRSA